MKRFYKQVAVAAEGTEFQVTLDSRPLRTPNKAAMALPNQALADAVAEEWAAQEDEIEPATMPLTRLSNSAIDLAETHRQHLIRTLADFVNADLICYRTDGPADLRALQDRHWQPVADWFERRFGIALTVTDSLLHVDQDREAEARLHDHVAAQSKFALTALHEMATITKSISLALALADEYMELDAIWRAARVDEDHQTAIWGEDGEEAVRVAGLRRDLAQAARFHRLALESA